MRGGAYQTYLDFRIRLQIYMSVCPPFQFMGVHGRHTLIALPSLMEGCVSDCQAARLCFLLFLVPGFAMNFCTPLMARYGSAALLWFHLSKHCRNAHVSYDIPKVSVGAVVEDACCSDLSTYALRVLS